MFEKQLYIKLFSNLLIPVLGFLVWNWSLYFILLFYFLDIFSSEIVHILKIRKVKSIPNKEKVKFPSQIYLFISIMLLLLTIGQINLGMILYQPEIDIKSSIWEFLTYKELGIPQGLVLIPLVIAMAYTSYKTEFINVKLYLIQKEKFIWKQHIKERFLLFSFCCILTLFAVSFNFQDWLVLTIILVFTSMYNFLQGKENIKRLYQQ